MININKLKSMIYSARLVDDADPTQTVINLIDEWWAESAENKRPSKTNRKNDVCLKCAFRHCCKGKERENCMVRKEGDEE